MDVKMGNGAVSLGDALFPLFPCLWVSLCNSKCPQEGALATTLPQGAPRAAIYTWHAETAPPRERPLHCKHRHAPWSGSLPALANPSPYTLLLLHTERVCVPMFWVLL